MTDRIRITLVLDGKRFGERLWPQAPTPGQQIGFSFESRERVGTIRNVVWDDDGEAATVHMTLNPAAAKPEVVLRKTACLPLVCARCQRARPSAPCSDSQCPLTWPSEYVQGAMGGAG